MLGPFVALALSSAPIVVAPQCILSRETVSRLVVHTSIDSTWMKGGKQHSSGPQLFSLNCDLASKRCDGLNMPLIFDKLGFDAVRIMRGAEIVSLVGSTAIVSWGVHQFVVDLAAGTVTHSDKGGAHGVGSCGTLQSKSEDTIVWGAR